MSSELCRVWILHSLDFLRPWTLEPWWTFPLLSTNLAGNICFLFPWVPCTLFKLRPFEGNMLHAPRDCCVVDALAICFSDLSLLCCKAEAYEFGIVVAWRLRQSTLTQEDILGEPLELEEEPDVERCDVFSEESPDIVLRKWGMEELIGFPMFAG